MRTLIVMLMLPVVLSACAGKAVSTTGAIDDHTISTRVKTAFINDPLVGALRIDVETFKGVVTLRGRVKTKDEEQKAMQIARTIRGVVDVKSELQIEQLMHPFTLYPLPLPFTLYPLLLPVIVPSSRRRRRASCP